MMIPEAMLCGTPVVAFNMGGAGELITPLITGYMAQLRDSADLAQGVFHVLSASDLPRMRAACRDAAVRLHDPSRVAKQHLDLYAMLKAEAST
jgi:glycosyltransferase involved in cell wall biosynthesis